MQVFYKYSVILLIGLLSFPSVVELTHVFAGHEHNFCEHYSDSHFHQKNEVCSLFHFQKNTFSEVEFLSFTPFVTRLVKEKDTNNYRFLSTTREVDLLLRGPPAVFYTL
jgi:hypothetical protein